MRVAVLRTCKRNSDSKRVVDGLGLSGSLRFTQATKLEVNSKFDLSARHRSVTAGLA